MLFIGKSCKAAVRIAILLLVFAHATTLDAQGIDSSTWSKTQLIEMQLKDTNAPAIAGRPIAVDRDSGCLLETRTGELHLLYWDDLKSATVIDEEFKPATIKEVAELLAPINSDVKALTSEHYVVLYRGSPAYAQWIMGLYERLYKGYYAYWKNLGMELHEPEFPLIVNVYAERNSYLAHAQRDKVGGAESIIGYYHQYTNQTVSYDLTETQVTTNTQNVAKQSLINIIRSKPGWERTVATIVHECSHQLAYNSGLQVRLADNPLWLSEGLAMFFEAPDLNSTRGWNGIGKVNQFQLLSLRKNAAALTSQEWITTLIQDDESFKNGETVNLAYAQSWALTYHLLKTRPKDFAKYMKAIGAETPLAPMDSKKRTLMFQEHFGEDILAIQNELIKKISRLQ